MRIGLPLIHKRATVRRLGPPPPHPLSSPVGDAGSSCGAYGRVSGEVKRKQGPRGEIGATKERERLRSSPLPPDALKKICPSHHPTPRGAGAPRLMPPSGKRHSKPIHPSRPHPSYRLRFRAATRAWGPSSHSTSSPLATPPLGAPFRRIGERESRLAQKGIPPAPERREPLARVMGGVPN